MDESEMGEELSAVIGYMRARIEYFLHHPRYEEKESSLVMLRQNATNAIQDLRHGDLTVEKLREETEETMEKAKEFREKGENQ
ncbi:hypothetical protein [Halorarum salinum]|uniref:Uncharacterized protein n=1 Tax=Halorarum salinum TaxID=2743089 RepID=A0A7D5LAM0_9EURY|nr:hypothetical protein [Halobaculum salinum]QLG62028.1 hypothetical protein HUG12_09945 [Halobaculum salinum]